jgi:hypothetical protein
LRILFAGKGFSTVTLVQFLVLAPIWQSPGKGGMIFACVSFAGGLLGLVFGGKILFAGPAASPEPIASRPW